MSLSRNSQLMDDGLYRIKDVPSQLTALMVTLILAGFFFYYTYKLFNGFFNGEYGFGDFLGGFGPLAVLYLPLYLASARLSAVWNGVELNLSARTIEFPGGGLSADDLTDYIKISYLLQYFRRVKVNLDDVSHMEVETVTKRTWNKLRNRFDYNEIYYINLSGTFGAAYIKILDEGKCNELFTTIRQLNRMGEPRFSA